MVDRHELQGALTSMVTIVDLLLEKSCYPRGKYWGEMLSEIDKIASQGEMHSSLRRKLDDARRAAGQMGPIDLFGVEVELGETSESVTRYHVEDFPDGAAYWHREQCRICGRPATVFSETWITEPTSHFNSDEPYVQQYASSIAYRCDSCGLELDADEMRQLGLVSNWVLRHRPATADEISSYEEYLEESYYNDRMHRD